MIRSLATSFLVSILVATQSSAQTPTSPQRARRLPGLLIVDASGAPGAHHSSLGAAIRAAVDGDRILVRDGAFGPVEVVAKTLTIEADTTRRSYVESVTVRDLAAGQSVIVRGLGIAEGGTLVPESALVVRNCAGSVWLEELSFVDRAADFQGTLVSVEDSDSVVISRCRLDPHAPAVSPVLDLRGSTTYLFDTFVDVREGQTVVHQQDGFLGIYGVQFHLCNYCSGGRSLHLTGSDPVCQLQGVSTCGFTDCLLPPLVEAGSVETVASLPRTHTVESPVYDDDEVEIGLAGRSGDVVWLLTAGEPAPGSFLSGVDVPLTLPGTADTMLIGTMSSSSTQFERPSRDLPGGTSDTLCYQTIHLNAAADEQVLSEPTAVTFLDASLRSPEYFYSDEPAWEASPAGNVAFGASIASAGDVNGDGFEDVIIGDPGYDYTPDHSSSYPAYFFHGRAHTYHGSPSGLVPAWSHVGGNPPTIFGEPSPSGFGVAVGAAGDVNGDGFGDVFVTRSDVSGRLEVFYGSPAGVTDAGATNFIPGSFEGWGTHLSAVGDVNGDGFDDLWMFAQSSGRLYHGSASGLATTPAWTHTLPTSSCCGPAGVRAAGDVNGDGFPDLLIKWYRSPGTPRRPSITLILGGATPSVAWTYENESMYHSSFAGVGDLDQDGFDDLVFCAEPQRMLVFHGAAPAPVSTPDQVVATPFLDGGYGGAIRPIGDVDADGRPDVLAGGDDGWSLLRGAAGGPRRSPSWDRAYNVYPYRGDIAVVGDVNGDGRRDVLVGTYDGNLQDGAGGGKVELLLGKP